ncbi:FadR/GntR family transcriptional regulator [Sphingobium sp. HWE2-09]|uniref:FadR/GntR family transcriptional regulator n=1 Tax=Sphingobium sp. HWE2-09 TaxID=3108390 RepID=UPI002DCFB58E|nr:FadR/GntR family transcriptional regulator [Sphingobium sp. HWE2-09]
MTNLTLFPARKEKLSDRLYDQLLEQIASGILRQGDKLPSENELCQLFSVSRPVVRQALVRLKADGLVATRKGLGTIVQSSPPEGLTRFSQPGDVAHMLRCLELRLALEGQAAGLAATRHSTAQLRGIRKALDRMEQEADGVGISAAADYAFHAAVAAASGNTLIEQVLESLDQSIQRGMVIALGLTSERSRERSQRVLDEHRAIYEAIQRGDGQAGELAMRYHLDRVRQRVTDKNRDQ